MKFFLSSYRLPDRSEELPKLFAKGKPKVAVVPNALDVYTDLNRRNESLEREKAGLVGLGIEPEVVDLRGYFDKPEELAEKMSLFEGVWVLGGNTFALRRAYRESGMDRWLQSQKENKEFVYSGYSAGVCVLSPTLEGLETVDDPNKIPEGYPPDVIWEGLNLIPFTFAPHFRSPHPESAAVEDEVAYYEKKGIDYRPLRDGEAIVIDELGERKLEQVSKNE